MRCKVGKRTRRSSRSPTYFHLAPQFSGASAGQNANKCGFRTPLFLGATSPQFRVRPEKTMNEPTITEQQWAQALVIALDEMQKALKDAPAELASTALLARAVDMRKRLFGPAETARQLRQLADMVEAEDKDVEFH
jgi:hypothetical protein